LTIIKTVRYLGRRPAPSFGDDRRRRKQRIRKMPTLPDVRCRIA
jgi:hypothetical protein